MVIDVYYIREMLFSLFGRQLVGMSFIANNNVENSKSSPAQTVPAGPPDPPLQVCM